MGRRLYVALSILVAAGAGFVVSSQVGARSTTFSVRSVRSVTIPDEYLPRLSAGAGELGLTNCVPKDASGVKVGHSLLIDATTLRLRSTGCTPFPLGKSVAITEVQESSLPNIWTCKPDSLGTQAIRKGPGGSAEPVGPVLFGYSGTCSHTAPLTAYGGDSLWVYDCSAGATGNGGQIVELSASTGKVELSETMAALCWTTFAADDDGAFVSTFEPGVRSVGEVRPQPSTGGIYFVANGASQARLALRTSGAVTWTYGTGDALYANVEARSFSCAPIRCGIWRLEGPSAKAQLINASGDGDVLAFNAPVGDSASGLLFATEVPFSKQPNAHAYWGPSTYELRRLDLASRTWQQLATLRLPYPSYAQPSLAYLDGALFAYLNGHLYRYQLS